MKTDKIVRYTTYIICLIVAFSIGFSAGSLNVKQKNADQYLEASQELFKAQGDSPESIKASLDLIKITKQNELGSEMREHLAIWLPTILIIINIVVAIIFERRKIKRDG